MCHWPHSLDVSSFQDPPHSQFLFLLHYHLWVPDLFWGSRSHISVFHVHFLFLTDPFSVCSFISISFRSCPYRDSFDLFLGLIQLTLHIIEGGLGGKATGFMFCLLCGFFFQSLTSSFIRCIYAISFHRILSRVFMERMSFFGDCGVVGGWMNLLYRVIE